MKTVIEMASEVFDKMPPDRHCREPYWTATDEELERFAELVRADERERGQKWFDAVTAQHKQEILAEREACAKVCDDVNREYDGEEVSASWIAAAIRARSNTK